MNTEPPEWLGQLRPLVPYVKPYRWRLFILGLALIGVTALEGIGIGLLFPLVEYVELGDAFQSQGRSARVVFSALSRFGLKPSVGLFIGVIFTVVLSVLILKFVVTRASAWVYNPLSSDLREAAFGKIIQAHLFYFHDHTSGALINTIDNEIDYLAVSFNFGVIMITAVFSISLYVAFILFISWKLTLLMAVLGLMRYGVAGIFFRRMRRHSVEFAALREELKSHLVGIHQGVELIKSYGAELREQLSFKGLSDKIRSNADEHALNTARSQFSDGLLGEGLLCGLVYIAISVFHLPGTALLTFLIIATRIIPKISGVNESRVRITEHLPRVTALPKILSGADVAPLDWGSNAKLSFDRSISLDDVSFSYPDGKLPSIRNVSLEIKKGETIAVVGESGSGKSTLARLLLRLFDPTEGAIRVDGVPLPQIQHENWVNLISIVNQDTFVFDASVEKNVKYGRPDATDAEVRQALRRARAEDFVKNLSQRQDTRLGERGIRLSGGQRQRIAIARAFLRDAPILILDEATSAMDAITERQIHEAISELAKGRTMIIIAHRFATIRSADRIIVLDKGRLIESGTHDQLIRDSGMYKKFYELQTI